jgi:hypothetical protein
VALTGDVKSSGNLTAMGGDAKEPELTTEEARYDCCFMNYRGGFGGKIRVKVSGHDFDSIYMQLPQLSMTFGSVALSGNLSVAGGDSGLCESQVPEEIAGRFPDMHSGRGGKIEIGNYFGCFGPALNVNLLGYASIAMAGGDSNRIGGRGGVVMINVPFDEMLASNEMRSIAKQGYRSELNNLRLLGTGIVNQAALDLSGGNGVYLGGSGGKFMAASEGPLTNSGAADLAGGNGLVGGNGHDPFNRSLVVLISGTLTTNSGALILKGGDVVLPEGQDIAPENAMVGGGGFAGLFSQKAATINSGDINVAPGSGIELAPEEFAERVGNILIDLFDVTPPNGVLDL